MALFIFAGTLASCGGAGGTAEVSTAETDTSAEESTAPAEDGYKFPIGYEERTFRILNYEDVFSQHAKISPETEDGDVLNDIQYRCVSTLEDRTGVILEETNRGY